MAKAKRHIHYGKIVHALPDVMYQVDDKGRFIFLSEAIKNFGYEPQELEGKVFTSIVHPQDRKKVSLRSVISSLKGKKTGDEKAPKIFDERRTGKRMTKNLEVRIVPGNSEKARREVFYVEVHSSGEWKKGGGE